MEREKINRGVGPRRKENGCKKKSGFSSFYRDFMVLLLTTHIDDGERRQENLAFVRIDPPVRPALSLKVMLLLST